MRFWSVSHQLRKFSMETIISGHWWRSHQSSRMQRFTYFQILCYVLEGWIKTQHQILLGKKSWVGSNVHHKYRTLDTIDGEPIKMGDPAQFQGRVIFMSMFNDISRTLVISLDLDQKRSGILLTSTDHEENGTESLTWWWSNSEKTDTHFSEPGVHCPEERSKTKEVENYQYTSVPMWIRLKLFFAQLFLFVNQLSIYGAVSDLCEEYSACQTRTERPVLAGQSDLLFEPAKLLITTPTLSIEIPAQENLLQKYKERLEILSQPDRMIKICTDAGFLKTGEVGQYFMTMIKFSRIVVEILVLQFLHLILDGDGFWVRLQLENLVEVASARFCPTSSMWHTTVLGIFWIPL